MYISMFDDEDDILTTSNAKGFSFGLDDGGSDSASDAAKGDANGGSTYSVDVKTFN